MKKKYKLNTKTFLIINSNGSTSTNNSFFPYLNIESNSDFLTHNSWKKNTKDFEKQEQSRNFNLKYSFFK
jgi:hypothetical protein